MHLPALHTSNSKKDGRKCAVVFPLNPRVVMNFAKFISAQIQLDGGADDTAVPLCRLRRGLLIYPLQVSHFPPCACQTLSHSGKENRKRVEPAGGGSSLCDQIQSQALLQRTSSFLCARVSERRALHRTPESLWAKGDSVSWMQISFGWMCVCAASLFGFALG